MRWSFPACSNGPPCRLAISFFLVGSCFFLLNQLGITLIHHMRPNVLAIGLFWELLLLLIFITLRFQNLVRDNARLKIAELEAARRQAAQIILAQDEERQ